jgi:hypothetical protein
MDNPEPEDADKIVMGLEGVSEIFVEGYRGAMFRAGVVKLNMFSTRVLGPGQEISKQAACILSVPLIDLKEIVPALAKLIEHIESQMVLTAETGSP